MRRLLLVLSLLVCVLLVPVPVSRAYTLGISDQQAATFTNPLFAPLQMKAARYIAPYDVVGSSGDKAQLDAWVAAARAAGQRILISFEHSHRLGHERHLPSVGEYARQLRRFRRAYPFIKEISPWNEVTRCQTRVGTTFVGQPTCRSPRRVAEYYMSARKVFGHATIVGIDLLDEQNVNKAVMFLRSFLHFAHPRPRVIGFHNYSDTNRFSLSRTRRVLAAFPGRVWLTETGGIVKLGDSLPFSTRRAARALGCMFTVARSSRQIARVYVYQFSPPSDPASARVDAGLINPDLTARPGYDVVKARKAGSCSRRR